MKIQNVTDDNIYIGDLRGTGPGGSTFLKPGDKITIYNEDAERSFQLNKLAELGKILITENSIEPSTGTLVQEIVDVTAVGNDLPQWNANKLQTTDVSPAIPTDGQILTYNSGTNEWEPADNTAEDHLLRVSSTDTTSKFLDPSITVDSTLTKTITTPGVNEHLNLKVDTTVIQAKSEKDQPNGYAGVDGSGTLSSAVSVAESQVTNLTTDLAAKADDASVIHLAGTETITGSKTFSSDILTPPGIKVDGVDISTHKHTGVDGTPKVLGTTIDSTGATAGQILTADGAGISSWQDPTGGGHIIEDEGTPVTPRPILDFVGPGVTVTDTGTKNQISIPGGAFAKDILTVSNVISDHTIVLSNIPKPWSEILTLNGAVLKRGGAFDYTILADTITIVPAVTLHIGDEIQITYSY